MFLGWTMKQWAIALGVESSNPKTIDEAIDIQRKWEEMGRVPSEKQVIIMPDGKDTRIMDFEAARNLFHCAYKLLVYPNVR